MTSEIETAAMRRALDAALSVPRTLPNPRVGCVLLDGSGAEIAVGRHRGAGMPHAEADALNRAGDRARGATAIVTLEPCRHTGRTGPCTEALIAAGVARVVFAQSDPTAVAAGGANVLAEAGIDVESGVLADESAAINTEWTHAVTRGRPFVSWKFAATLDGRSAAADGSSQWITGPEARRDVHRLRSETDAVMVGTGTVLADDPRLTVRDVDERPIDLQPLRVVVGNSTLPEDSRVLDDDAETLLIPRHDPREVLAVLAQREVRHVWLEGGPTLAGAFWDAGLVDRVVAYLAPSILGAGRSAVEGTAATMSDLGRLTITDLTTIGDDIRIIATPTKQEG